MYRLIGFKLNVIKPLITATINETFQYPNNNQDIIKAIVAIPKTTVGISQKIPVLILVNDPSFILQRLLEAIISTEVTSAAS